MLFYSLRRFTSNVAFKVHRHMSTAVAVEKSTLSKLRKKTGFSFINCKNALVMFENDEEKAEAWLREQAQKEGWAKATKLQSRPMSQGLVGLIQNENTATLIEVNCETDFVAKNQKFVELVKNVTEFCNSHFQNLQGSNIQLERKELGSVSTNDGKSILDLVAYEVGNIGENMLVRRAIHMRASPNTSLSTFVHASGDAIPTETNLKLGKYGVICEFESATEDSTEIREQICQHIVGMNPKSIGEFIPKVREEVEEVVPDSTNEAVLEDNPESDSDQELETQSETSKSSPEEKALMQQRFLLDSSVDVQDILEDYDLKVVNFVRYECGESLPGEEDN